MALKTTDKELRVSEPSRATTLHRHEPQRTTSSIVQLPREVVAQIKSSAAITSLTSVILGLVTNSLDAQANKITIDVDSAHGGCVVEDDGLGILPSEFTEDGGLGKLYRKF